MIEPRTLPGFMELLPSDQVLFNNIKDTIKRNYEKFGFLPLDTPVLESSEVLLAKAGGETEKQIYQFKKGDNDLCMRFDLTVPLAKYVAANYNELSFPFARYQIDKVYRGERPQKGRFREFYQCDIDVIGRGELSLAYDAEIPCIMYNIFKELNIGDFTIQISNRKLLLGIIEDLGLNDLSIELLRLIDKKSKIGDENFINTLRIDYKVDEQKLNVLLSFLNIKGSVNEQLSKLNKLGITNEKYVLGLKELTTVIGFIQKFGVNAEYYTIDLTIARGLDYYTGTVYETFIKGYENIGSVCSGGRYDNLAEYYTKEKLPGVGMSIGLTRLFYQLKENGLLKKQYMSNSKCIVLPMGEEYLENCIALGNTLRANNINTTTYLDNAKFKTKLQYAIRSKVKYAIFVGEDEVKGNYYTIKDLENEKQEQLTLDKLLEILTKD
ncbi:MAG: histidine--tRNA ligase [Clostridia bacterium]|nr:histidine--tRNA ligase [Clostridia bacterium]